MQMPAISKKVQMLIGTILGNVLILIVYHLFPDIPSDVVGYCIAGISSTGIGGTLGQGFADGLSRGATSTNIRLEAERKKENK